MRVELGAGLHAKPGYVAVDINPSTRPALVASALDLPFATASITGLRAVDVLEHISYRDTDRVLAEWARVCKKDATLYVQVPDAAEIMHWFVTLDRRLTPPPLTEHLPRTQLAGATWRLLGGHADGRYVDEGGDWRWNAHYALFSKASLTEALQNAGFMVDRCETNPHPNLLAWCTRT